MNWAFLIAPIVAAILIVIIFKILPKKFKRAALFLVLIFVLIFATFSFFLAKDIAELHKSFRESKKTFIYVDDGIVRAGFWAAGNFDPLTDNELASFQKAYSKDSFPASSDHRFFVFDQNAFDKRRPIDVEDANLTVGDIMLVLEAPSASQAFGVLTGIPGEVIEEFYSENDLKARLFGYLVKEAFSDAPRLVNNFKEGSVQILPDSLTMYVVRALPASIMQDAFGLLFIIEEEV